MLACPLMREKPGVKQLAYLDGIADEIEGVAGHDTMLVVGAEVVGYDAPMA